jgi:hypothetical protein
MLGVKNAYVLGKRRNGRGTRTYVGMKFIDDDGNEKLVIQPGVSITGTVVFKEPEEGNGEGVEAETEAVRK